MKKAVASLFVLLLLVSPCQAAPQADQYDTVTKTLDDGTLQLSSGEKVRLIGIDTPESGNNAKTRRDSKRTGQDIKEITALGKQATAFIKQLVEGKQVRLEYDVTKKDKYRRTLAYVYVTRHCCTTSKGCADMSDFVYKLVHGDVDLYSHENHEVELFVNAEIIKAGYAQVMTYPPNVKYRELFVKLQKEARDNKSGL